MLCRLRTRRLDNSHDVEMRTLLRIDLLGIDDFALQPLDAADTTDVYELIVDRTPRRRRARWRQKPGLAPLDSPPPVPRTWRPRGTRIGHTSPDADRAPTGPMPLAQTRKQATDRTPSQIGSLHTAQRRNSSVARVLGSLTYTSRVQLPGPQDKRIPHAVAGLRLA